MALHTKEEFAPVSTTTATTPPRRHNAWLRRYGLPLSLSLLLVLTLEASTRRVRARHLVVKSLSLSTQAQVIAQASPSPVLECFQVTQPIVSSAELSSSRAEVGNRTHDAGLTSSFSASLPGSEAREPCSVLLMDYVFGNSYGNPFVGNYSPPACTYNRVVMNLTVMSAGRQFDRLAVMYFGDTEVWRTSTAEPTRAPGIRWTYLRDMTPYISLWKTPQKLIFDLGNLINVNYTASFNATLTATFLNDPSRAVMRDGLPPADLIVPISAGRGISKSEPSAFIIPTDNSSSSEVSLPANARRAVFTISACGQAEEEFWWSNVLESDSLTFNRTVGQLAGLSPFREVQVLIDGVLAGVQWPFPVIFTGGVVPSLHRPIVGLDAFDLRESEIDVSLWLPILTDGKTHEVKLRVVGLRDNGRGSAAVHDITSSYWVVTGKIFVWLNRNVDGTANRKPELPSSAIGASEPRVQYTRRLAQNSTGFNESVTFDLKVERNLVIQGRLLHDEADTNTTTAWVQKLTYRNQARIADFGAAQVNDITNKGTESTIFSSSLDDAEGEKNGKNGEAASDATSDSSVHNKNYKFEYKYPLFCDQRTELSSTAGSFSIEARLIQGQMRQLEGTSVFGDGLAPYRAAGLLSSTKTDPHAAPDSIVEPGEKSNFSQGSILQTTRDGTASFVATGNMSFGSGMTNQALQFGTVEGQRLYFRNVTAINDSVVSNREDSVLKGTLGSGSDWSGDGHDQSWFSNEGDYASSFTMPRGRLWGIA